MIIGYDGKRAVMNNTGLGNYSRLLVDNLASVYPENTYRLYTPRLQPNKRLVPLMKHTNVEFALPAGHGSHRPGAIWRVGAMGRQMVREGADLIHGLSGELPLNAHSLQRPTVVTMHDVIFRRYPELYGAIDRRIYDYKFAQAARQATRVLAISECTARDVMEFYGVPEEKIDVVYQGCAAQFHRIPDAAEIEAVKRRYGLDPSRPYIISVGTIERRKNQLQAVRGIRGLPDDFYLLLVGRRTEYAAEIDNYISQNGLADRVKFIERVEFSDLPALYAGAFCSSYTSRFEGFGIPVIESLSTGTPVVVATGSCLEEAAGPSAPAIDPDSVEQWITEMRRIYDSADYRRSLVEEGQRYVERFSDENMARGTMKCYKRAINQFNRQ